MTALNQAIIKAYLRKGGQRSPDEAVATEPVRLDAPTQEAPCATESESNRALAHQAPVGTPRQASVPLDALGFTGTALSVGVAKVLKSPVAESSASTTALDNLSPCPEQGTLPNTVRPSGSAFEPTLRVDAISWPRPSRRLRQEAAQQIERLADAVRKAASSGGKTVGVASFSHGEGCTTVLLAVALRLVELGQKTLLLDGDVVQPKLAEQLALENEAGWRDVAAGAVSLEDAVTQSDSECLALLPYCGFETRMDGPAPSEQDIATLLDRIRTHYDMILVDLGGALTSGGNAAVLAERLTTQIDSVLTVQNVMATSASSLAMLRQHLQRLGVNETGIIENFVDDATA